MPEKSQKYSNQASRKRRVMIALFVLAGLIEGALTGKVFLSQQQQALHSEQKEALPTTVPHIPKMIYLPKIGIEAEIVPVGINHQGEMEMPQNPWQVGWFENSIGLGKNGSLVIAGHLDSASGPAVFYRLSTLEKGDLVYLWDENNNRFVFEVVKKETYSENQFPLTEIFGANDSQYLNLITCTGQFDRQRQRYPERLVVHCRLKPEKSTAEDESKF